MTRLPGIGPTASEIAAQVAREERARFDDPRDAAGRRNGARDGGFNAEMRFGQFDLEKGFADDREAAFLDKVRRALSESGEATAVDEDAKAPRLLAMAGDAQARVEQAALPLPAGAAPVSARIETLAERIEQGLRAALVSGPAGNLSITLDLGGAGGFAGVTVSMSPDMVDVVLTRADLPAAEDMAAAAQALADRLQARFPRRIVRVFEAEASAGDRGGVSALDEIGALLSRPGGVR